ncbi:MAG: hypothetical protein EHM43_07110 [Ignavibacteriae bacterium]|jgi:hypothetical protein|nr:MAG: hypothetical protein EHM43_07110 [Ignavibacteriota bacterium]
MKLLMEPIDVAEHAAAPSAFCWQGRLFEVETVLENWSARGTWWGIDDRREYYLLMTQNGVMEIFRSRNGWMLSRVYD